MMTSLAEITPSRALLALRQAVAGREGTIYVNENGDRDGCYYIHGDLVTGTAVPGCLIAHALHAEGVSLETLSVYEGVAVAGMFDRGSTAAGNILEHAQVKQDRGRTWGEALRAAEAKARDLGVTDADGEILAD